MRVRGLRQMLIGASAAALGVGGWAALGAGTASAQFRANHKPQGQQGQQGEHGKKGEHGAKSNRLLLNAPMAPSLPDVATFPGPTGTPLAGWYYNSGTTTDPALFGIAPGSLPWVIASGHVRLGANGTLRLTVARLLVPKPGGGGFNPLAAKNVDVQAAVYCNGALAVTSPAVPLSAEGNAHIAAKVALPPMCAMPGVLLETAEGTPMYIAYDGQGPTFVSSWYTQTAPTP